jgi:S-adenosylmethionine decarboxylase
MEKMTYYGPHLTLDLGDCDVNKLNSLEVCFDFLYDLPIIIDMNKITQPYVFRYEGRFPEEAGITGCVIIAESHISIHTYPLKAFAFVDVFSCKPFDVDKAKEYIIKYFDSRKPITNVVNRGEYF